MTDYEYGNGWTKSLPKSVQVGNLVYHIELMPLGMERDARRFGECLSNDQVIRIGQMQQHQKARDTLLHEITHAAAWVYDLMEDEDTIKEERLCSLLPMILMCLKRDSPDVWRWIFDE